MFVIHDDYRDNSLLHDSIFAIQYVANENKFKQIVLSNIDECEVNLG